MLSQLDKYRSVLLQRDECTLSAAFVAGFKGDRVVVFEGDSIAEIPISLYTPSP